MTLRFCGIGAMRCATTWTFGCLQRHPDVAFPAGKQIHYWDKHRDRGDDWYRGLFDAESPIAEGEITPAYALLDHGRVAQFKTLAPDLRVWFVMRDPVDRAWSSVRLHIRRNELDPASLDSEWFEKRVTAKSVARRNRYHETLRIWQDHFGTEAVLALPYSLAESDPQRFLGAIGTHIGVDPAPFLVPDDALGAEIAGTRNVGYELAMPASIRALATEFYANEISWYEQAVSNPAG